MPRPPIPTEKLRELSRTTRVPLVRALLWEIQRLRLLVRDAYRALHCIQHKGLEHDETIKRLEDLDERLIDEPVVVESRPKPKPVKRETEWDRRVKRG
jgi:hypothetical protein